MGTCPYTTTLYEHPARAGLRFPPCTICFALLNHKAHGAPPQHKRKRHPGCLVHPFSSAPLPINANPTIHSAYLELIARTHTIYRGGRVRPNYSFPFRMFALSRLPCNRSWVSISYCRRRGCPYVATISRRGLPPYDWHTVSAVIAEFALKPNEYFISEGWELSPSYSREFQLRATSGVRGTFTLSTERQYIFMGSHFAYVGHEVGHRVPVPFFFKSVFGRDTELRHCNQVLIQQLAHPCISMCACSPFPAPFMFHGCNAEVTRVSAAAGTLLVFTPQSEWKI